MDACSTGTKNPFLACVLTSLTVLLGERESCLSGPVHRKNPRRPRHFLKWNPQLALRRQCPLLPQRCKNLCRVLQQTLYLELSKLRDFPRTLPYLWFPSCPKLAYKWVSAHMYSWGLGLHPRLCPISAVAPSQSLGGPRTWLEGSGPSISSRALLRTNPLWPIPQTLPLLTSALGFHRAPNSAYSALCEGVPVKACEIAKLL